MAQQFDGKVFVTTNVKAQAVKSLLDYWTMKTELLRKRQDPTAFANKDVQQKTKDYLVKNTKLREQSFFKSLNEEAQEKATKCFSMQEVSKPKKEMISRNRLKAVVYICLSGFAVVRNLKTDEQVRYGVGEVFGSEAHFHKVIVEGEEMVDGHPDDQGSTEEIIDFGEGTFVRMELNDLYNTILKPDDNELAAIEEKKEQESAVQISGIAWEKMSEDDKFYVRVYKRTKELVNKRFFSFLDSYRMIPKNASMASYRYYHEGNKGRDIYLDRRDQSWVFVFIDGSIKVELCTTKINNADHTISYVRKGEENSMHIKKKTMPLLQLSSGAVLCVHPDCFTLADDPDDGDEDDYESIVSKNQHDSPIKTNGQPQHHHNALGKPASKFRSRFPPSRNNNATTNALGDRAGTASRPSGSWSSDSSVQTAGTFHTVNSAIDSYLHRRSDVFEPHATPPEGDDAQYHIKLVFQATTSYLAVPYANFARILDDNKLVLPKIAKEIKWYLQSPSDQVKDRITRLLPWVQGNIDFNQREKSSKVLKTLDFLPAELGPRTDELTATLGSFANTQALSSADSDAGSADYRAATPNLAPPAPSSLKETPNYSFKSTKRRNSDQDNTMSNMLLELRKSRDLSQKNSQKGSTSSGGSIGKSGALPLRASMFMTQDGERDFSIVEESAIDSDSDVDVDDFRAKKGMDGVRPKRSEFSDSTNSMKSEPVLDTLSLHAPNPHSVRSNASSLEHVLGEGSEDGSLKKIVGISVINNSSVVSVLDMAPGSAADVDLQSLTG